MFRFNSPILSGEGLEVRLSPLLWTIRVAAALGFTSLGLTGELSPPYWILGASAWVLGLALDRRPRWQQRMRAWETTAVLLMVTVFGLDFFFWGYSIFVSIAHFLMLFQAFKLIGLKTRKDCLQILIFSFFQLLSACTLSVDAWQGLILLLLIPIATAGLFWQQISREIEETGQEMPPSAGRPFRRLLAIMCLSAIPINIVLAGTMFMIFPRLAFRGAFAGLGAGRSGYNEQIDLDQTGVLALDNSAVLWLQITPALDRFRWKGYLRGGTLDHFDGKKWSRRAVGVTQTLYADSRGLFNLNTGKRERGGLRQIVTLVNTEGATLFGSPYVGQIIAPLATLQLTRDGGIRWARGWRKPLRYEMISYDRPLESDAPRSQGRDAVDYLQLPAVSLDRTRQLARDIAGKGSPRTRARRIADHLHSQYTYSLVLGPKASANPVEDFLFLRRKGPCGHFASAFAVMLRLEGIPARVVAGYYKGTWNGRVDQYLFRERDAHAWVEGYIPGTGWVPFDPSPRPASAAVTDQWKVRLQETWGYLNYHWDRLVIEYDLYSQVRVVQDLQSSTQRMNASIAQFADRHLMGFRRPGAGSPMEPVKILLVLSFAGILAVVLIGAALWKRRRPAQANDPAIAFYQRFLARMARQGFPKSPSETGWEYSERLRRQSVPGLDPGITQRYYVLRFRKPEIPA